MKAFLALLPVLALLAAPASAREEEEGGENEVENVAGRACLRKLVGLGPDAYLKCLWSAREEERKGGSNSRGVSEDAVATLTGATQERKTALRLGELLHLMRKIDSSELIWTSSESDEIFDTPRSKGNGRLGLSV